MQKPETESKTVASVATNADSEAIATNVDDAGSLLGIGTRRAWQLVKSGELASFKCGRRRLVRIEDLRRYAAARTEQATR